MSIGHHFSIDGEMSNVCDIEVWGCGGSDALKEQQKMKLRIKQQADRNKKVFVFFNLLKISKILSNFDFINTFI